MLKSILVFFSHFVGEVKRYYYFAQYCENFLSSKFRIK